MRPVRSIALKMTLLVLAGTGLVFASILVYSYVYSKHLILEETEDSLQNLCLAAARQIDSEMRSVEQIPQDLACFIETVPCDGAGIERLLKNTVQCNREIYGSTVAFEPRAFDKDIDAYAPYFYKGQNGIELVQLGNDTYNYSQHDWYHIPRTLGAPVWSEPFFDEGGGNVLMATYSYPVFETSGDGMKGPVKAIATADVSLEGLTKLVSSINIGRTGYCFLITANGTFLTHPNSDLVMRETVFSLAEERGAPGMRELGRAMLREKSGFAHLGAGLTGQDSYLAWAKVPSTGWSLGAVFPKTEMFAEVEKLHSATKIMAVLGILLLLGVSLFVAKSITKPLRRLALATATVGKGDLNVDLSDIRTRDEVGQLAESFARMVQGLKERDFIRDTFGRYLTKEVVNRLLESRDGLKLGGESREISLLMSDIRGFTAITVSLEPEQLVKLLNRYLGKMLEILLDHHGVIDEIIGDGILAFFGAPEAMEDHPAAAVACALKMQLAMEEINALNDVEGLPRLEMGIAVNTGEVVLGNIGSEKRTKYGAVGPEVNLTGRLESFTVGGQVLISEATYERLSGVLEIGKVLQVDMKGVPGTVNLYDVKGIRGGYDILLPHREDEPQPLERRIEVLIQLLEEKTVTQGGTPAWITHLSMSSALLLTPQVLTKWDNIRIRLLNERSEPVAGDAYAKVVVAGTREGLTEARVHFTSLSADAQALFRRKTRPAPQRHVNHEGKLG